MGRPGSGVVGQQRFNFSSGKRGEGAELKADWKEDDEKKGRLKRSVGGDPGKKYY